MQVSDSYEVVLRPEARWLDLRLADLWQYRDLVALLVQRDFVAKYKQTILGPAWFVLQPLLMTIVFTIVFGRVFAISTDGLPPMLFFLCGQLGWNFFSQSFTTNAATFVTQAPVFSKVFFPRLVVPLATLASGFLTFALQVATFAVFFVAFKFGAMAATFGLDWHLALLPLLVLQTAALSLGASLLMAALTAKYRDLTHVTPLLLQIWMYLTPVIYPLSRFPVRWRWLAAVNPMTPVMEAYRKALLGVGTVEPAHVAWSLAVTAVVLVTGVMFFCKVERTFVDTV